MQVNAVRALSSKRSPVVNHGGRYQAARAANHAAAVAMSSCGCRDEQPIFVDLVFQ